MSAVAAVRPDSWNLPLLVHVLGALILVGGLFAGASTLALARGDARLLRLGYWSLLALALPGWIVMRVGAGWVASKGGWDDLPDELLPTWLELGFVVADIGAVVLAVTLVLGGVGVYRLGRGGGTGALKVTLALCLILLAAYVVAVWAMAGKPD